MMKFWRLARPDVHSTVREVSSSWTRLFVHVRMEQSSMMLFYAGEQGVKRTGRAFQPLNWVFMGLD